jgi:hypothetical protein
MPYYSSEHLLEIDSHFVTVRKRYEDLMILYSSRTFKDARAREFAAHGFPRRLKTLVRCIDNVFAIIPPDQEEFPTANELADCTINIQAFIFNAFASIDNLAWIWVQEKQLTRNGKPLGKREVGLRKHNEIVRASFSPSFRDYLDNLENWFVEMGDFRDALAHRVPLYIPPYVVKESNGPAYNDLSRRMEEAFRCYDFDKHDALEAEQQRLGLFIPVMTHSFSEQVGSVCFHPQILADFATVEDLGSKFLDELNRPAEAGPLAVAKRSR